MQDSDDQFSTVDFELSVRGVGAYQRWDEMGRDGTRSPERETGRLEIPGRERCNVTSRAV